MVQHEVLAGLNKGLDAGWGYMEQRDVSNAKNWQDAYKKTVINSDWGNTASRII